MKKQTIYFIELAPGLFTTAMRKPTAKVLRDMRYGFNNPHEYLGDLPNAQLKGRSLAIRYGRNEVILLTKEKVQIQLDGATEQYPAEAFYIECEDSPTGSHNFTRDIEYDPTGQTRNCDYCGELAPTPHRGN